MLHREGHEGLWDDRPVPPGDTGCFGPVRTAVPAIMVKDTRADYRRRTVL